MTKDSQYLLATAVDYGVFIYNVKDGSKVATVNVPGIQASQVGIAFGDKEFFVMYQHEKKSHIRIFELAKCLQQSNNEESKENTPKHKYSISGSPDFEYTNCVWGPLNKTLYVGTI